VLVQLSSDPSIPGLPLGVTVDPGQTKKAFSFSAPMKPGSYTVTATVERDDGSPISAQSQLVVNDFKLTDLTIDAEMICSDEKATGTVTITCPAPPEGTVVAFDVGATDNEHPSTWLDVPADVTVKAGQTTAMFTIQVQAGHVWTTGSRFTVVASRGNHVSREIAVEPTVQPFVVARPQIASGEATFFEIHLSCPAPKGGLLLKISSLDPAVLIALPGPQAADQTELDVTVPEGISYELVRVEAQKVSAPRTVGLTVESPTSAQAGQVTVLP
jgi:hypothetical protein